MTRLRILIAAVLGLVFLAGCGSEPVQPVPRAVDAVAPPVSIAIPKIRAQSSLIRTGVNPDKTIEVPSVKQPEQASWYEFSSMPGRPGPAVILGHVDGDGRPGIFHQVHTLKAGDRVIIERSDGSRLTYAVTRVFKTDKDEFPTERVYGTTNESELRLITCGGKWEGGQYGYADNIIVDARLI